MDIELRHLRYFTAVVEEMHFGRAAERLHLAQPSLSQQIRKLEEAIGVKLFDRKGRSIELTPAGEALAARTRRTFDDVYAAITAAQDAAAGVIGRFSVGFVETAAVSIVPDAVRSFREVRPRVALELRELPARAQVDELIRGHLDLGLVRAQPGHRDLVVERTIEEEFVAVLPAGHRLAGGEPLDPGTVVGEPLIMIDREQIPGLHDETMSIARERGVQVEISQRATSVLSALGLVSAGLGVSLLPGSVRGLVPAGVEYVSLAPAPRSRLLAVRHRENGSPQIEPFLAAIDRE